MPRVIPACQPELPFSCAIQQQPAAPIDGSADLGGTICQREIVKLFDGRTDRAIRRAEVASRMADLHHAPSTVERSIVALVQHGTLEHCPDGLRYTGGPLPPVKKNTSLPGAKANRFGHEDDASTWRFVREALADRLDEMFEQPNSYLRRVLQAVEWAGQMGRAMMHGDLETAKKAARKYREHWHDAETNAELRNLTAASLLDALQVALFPETYLPDDEVEAVLRRDILEAKASKARDLNEIIDENERRHERNMEILNENILRAKRGDDPLPLLELTPLDNRDDEPPRPSKVGVGLVPRRGPEKCGEYRAIVWLRMMGLTPPPSPAAA